DSMVPYETRVEGREIVVTLGTPAAAGSPVVASFPAADEPARGAAPGRRITDIDFRRGENGGGRIIVGLSDPGTPVDVRREGGNIVLGFGGTELPAELRKRLDVTDFATPVQAVEASSAPSGARLRVVAKAPYEELAYQSDDVFTVEISPVAPKPAATAKPTLFSRDREYAGERLTL